MSSTSPLKRSALPRLADAAASRARLVAVPRLRSRAPKIPFITLVSVILLGGVVGLLLFNTSMQQASFEASSLQDQADLLTAREQALQAETDALDNPDVIQQKAFAHHMVIPPGGNATVDLDKRKVTGDQAPAAADGALPPERGPVYQPVRETADATPPPVPQDDTPTGTGGAGSSGGSAGSGGHDVCGKKTAKLSCTAYGGTAPTVPPKPGSTGQAGQGNGQGNGKANGHGASPSHDSSPSHTGGHGRQHQHDGPKIRRSTAPTR